jgi:hypothetical protein
MKVVEFQINRAPVVSRMVRYHRGWQLEDISGPAGLWAGKPAVPKYDPREKNLIAQRDIQTIATALEGFSRYAHEFAFRDSGFLEAGTDFEARLRFNFVMDLPLTDPWGYPYFFVFGHYICGNYGLSPKGNLDYLILSMGRDGTMERWAFDPERPEAGLEPVWNPDHDIIMWNGRWIRGTLAAPSKSTPLSRLDEARWRELLSRE